jgi:hypothetical protein
MLFGRAESNAVMSRSRRNTPIVGLATSASEKTDKVMAHRRLRHAAKIAADAAAHDGDDTPRAESEHPRSGQWTFAKDGKHWIGRAASKRRSRVSPHQRRLRK